MPFVVKKVGSVVDPDPVFHFDADPDPNPLNSWNIINFSFTSH